MSEVGAEGLVKEEEEEESGVEASSRTILMVCEGVVVREEYCRMEARSIEVGASRLMMTMIIHLKL